MTVFGIMRCSVVPLSGRDHVWFAGTINFNMTSRKLMESPDVATLNLGRVWPVMVVGANGTLTFRNIHVKGFSSPYLPAVVKANLDRPLLSVSFPNIMLGPNSTLSYDSAIVDVLSGDCSRASQQEVVVSYTTIYGLENIGMYDQCCMYIVGNKTITVPIVDPNEVAIPGQFCNYYMSARYSRCEVDPWDPTYAARHASSSTHAGPPGWAWALIGIGVALLAVAALVGGLIFFRHRHKKKRLEDPSSHRPDCSDCEADCVGWVAPTPSPGRTDKLAATPSPPPLSSTALAAARIRVKFGTLDDLELGDLVGTGDYGRVYRARWLGVPVAVKVIQCNGSALAVSVWEGLLAASLHHPNVVATYKIGTLRAPGSTCSMTTASGVLPSALSLSPLLRSPATSSPREGSQETAIERSLSLVTTIRTVEGVRAISASPFLGGQPRSVVSSPQLSSRTVPVPPERGAALPSARRTGSAPLSSSGAAATRPPERTSSGDDSHAAVSIGSDETGPLPLLPAIEEPSTAYEMWMVLEYCDKGNLEAAIRRRRFLSAQTGKPLWRVVLRALCDVSRGMAYLHAHNIVHGDLKAANVLLKSGEGSSSVFVGKIADFGLSQMLGRGQTRVLTSALGSMGYMPPESMRYGQLTKATDAYSFGILAWEVTTCSLAFAGMSAAQVSYAVLEERYRPPAPDPELGCPPDLHNLIESCLSTEPSARPAFDEIVSRLETCAISLAKNQPKQQESSTDPVVHSR